MSESKETTYWKSLNELARNEEYKKFVEREFPEDASELTDQVSRRSFLRIMGASVALAGFAACRRPAQKIVPFSRMPEDRVLGQPVYYSTARPFQGVLSGLLAESNEGRPTKIEGNEQHPSRLGKTDIFDQASILNLYDPDRSRGIRRNGERSTREEFISFANSHFSNRQQRIAFITEENSSLTLQRLREQASERFPNAEWFTWEPFGDDAAMEGTRIAFGRRLRTVNHFDRAQVVVALDSDFMSPQEHKNSVENVQKLIAGRNVFSAGESMSRLYSVESTFTSTGSYADNRLRLKASEIEPFTYALAARLSGSLSGLEAFARTQNDFLNHQWVEILADDLLANRGASILTAGNQQPAGVHAAVAAINLALGNAGSTVEYVEVPYDEGRSRDEAFKALADELRGGGVQTVVILGANPVYTAPADLDFAGALSRAGTVIHLADYVDETSRAAEWHVNRAHFLEAWGDGTSFTGVRSVIQPQIQPLFDGWSEIELLNLIVNGRFENGYDLVRETWSSFLGNNFESRWEQILHDGLDEASGYAAANVSLSSGFANEITPLLGRTGIRGLEIVIKPDPTLFDGRFANNSWLQELPDPMTKITWDNVALMSVATARSLGISTERHLSDKDAPIVRINAEGTTIEIAAWVQPGHADDSITLTAGYGRSGIGRIADGVGVDVYPLRTTAASYYRSADVTTTGRSYEIACVQDHHSLEGRSLIREATLDEYRDKPDFASFESTYGFEVPGLKEAREEGNGEFPVSLFNPHDFPDHQPQWGMAIDLNACFGCGVCTIACQAENNIPVVGKREVRRRRMMHWIRTDRYYEGDPDNPRALHQPVPCMQCDLAPCEQVCPVAATTQSDDGINQMTYNRCIGTRYCANNCPYKVRRFNFFNYTKEFLANGDEPEIIQMAMNPEVTVRFRGVMEKCTYCVQRLNRARRDSRRETGSWKPADGTVTTACAQACPANAIHFGDISDPESHITRIKRNERNYLLLEELGTRPRTSYLGKVRNPNPQLG